MNEAQAGPAKAGGAGSSRRRKQAAIAVVVFGALLLISVLGLLRVPRTTVALSLLSGVVAWRLRVYSGRDPIERYTEWYL